MENYEPMHPGDFTLFMNARSIRFEHRNRFRNPDQGHLDGPRSECPECQNRANWALIAFAGRARHRSWGREEALAQLRAHPATYDTMAKEGRYRENAASRRLAKARVAAFGKVYESALRSARRREELSVSVPIAQELLAWVIRHVQDDAAPTETGMFVPWTRLEEDLGWAELVEQGHIRRSNRAWHVWSEITGACDVVPRAQRMLDDHVFRHSAGLSRHVAYHSDDDDDQGQPDMIESATSDQSLTSSDECHALTERIATRVASQLSLRMTLDPALALALCRQALQQELGLETTKVQELQEYLEQVSADAVEAARLPIAMQDAARNLASDPRPSLARARVRLVEALCTWKVSCGEPPKDPAARPAHDRWVQERANDVLMMASVQRQSQARSGRQHPT